MKSRLATKVIRNTNILDVSYVSNDPQVAANVIRTVVQSYLDFMDVIQKGTAGEISKVLTRERNEVAEKLNAQAGGAVGIPAEFGRPRFPFG